MKMVKKTLYSAPELRFVEAKSRRVLCSSFNSPESGDGTESYGDGDTTGWFNS